MTNVRCVEVKEPKMTKNNVCYYCPETKELKGSQVTKAKRFLRENCVRPFGKNRFVVDNIKGYNSQTYEVTLDPDSCTCQFNVKTGRMCSHILSCIYYRRINHD